MTIRGTTDLALRYADCHALFDAACVAVGGTGTSIQRGSGRLYDKYCLALSDVEAVSEAGVRRG